MSPLLYLRVANLCVDPNTTIYLHHCFRCCRCHCPCFSHDLGRWSGCERHTHITFPLTPSTPCTTLILHHTHTVTAPLLLDTADAFVSTGLRDSGYIYINTDDGWLDKNRTEHDQQLHPSTKFTTKEDGIKALADGLHAKGFKFGIYLAAGESTCGNRAGSLYFEFSDAMQVETFAETPL